MAAKENKSNLVSFFGGLTYLSIILQWAWVGLITLPALFENKAFRDFFLPHENPEPIVTTATQAPSPIMIAVAALITIFILVISVIILIRIPIAAAKSVRKMGTSATKAALPIITHNKKITQKKERHLSAVILFWIKIAVILLPVIVTPVFYLLPENKMIDAGITILISLFLAIGSLVWVLAEYSLAKLLNISLEKVF